MDNGKLPGTRNAAQQLVVGIACAVVTEMKIAGSYDKKIFLNRVFHYFRDWRAYMPADYENVDDELEHMALEIYELLENPTNTTTSPQRIRDLLGMMFEHK